MTRLPAPLFALLACAIATAALAWSFFGNPAAERRIATLQSDVASLKTEIASLRQQRVSSLEAPAGPPAAQATETPIVSSGDSSSVEARITNLERRTEDFELVRDALVDRGLLPPNPEQVAAAKAIVLDTTAPPETRVQALAILNRSKTEERSRDVVLSMIALLETDLMPKLQREIFKHLNGVTNPELKEPLRFALEQSESAFVREEAARALAAYRDDPTVQKWLEIIGELDPNGNVRGQALENLNAP